MPNLNHTVVSIDSLRTGMSINLGRKNPAYLAKSVHDGTGIVPGVKLVGSFEMDERDGEQFARITSVSDIIADSSASDSSDNSAPKARKLDRKVESVKPMRHGLSLDLGHDAPAYLAKSVHSGFISVGDRISGSYVMDERDGEQFARITAVDKVSGSAPARSNSGSRMRKLRRRVESVEQMKNGLSLDLGHEANAYLPNSLEIEGVEVGMTLVGSYRMATGSDGEKYARIISIDEISGKAEASADADTSVFTLKATSELSENNRFAGQIADGGKVVVQAMGRCVMYAKSLAKDGAELSVTGTVNSDVSGDATYIDASRVEKAMG
ncbi:MAG: hypothetical protein OXC95_05655 [Dehalococcoidia bacterium]|nr:hypothetical protein [Dehalococcoidia bacterium]